MEVLLLRRARSAGFVPGAYVFPGGRVDLDDAHPDVIERLTGITAEVATHRLGACVGDTPAIAYYLAALREAFEETGILVALDNTGTPLPSAAANVAVARLQDSLLAETSTFAQVLQDGQARLNGEAIEYIAHWVTPLIETRRYDTRFFAAEVPPGTTFRLSPSEMTGGVWITPQDALDRQRVGTLPMVFPTIRTLEDLLAYDTPAEAIGAIGTENIREILPKLVRTPTGVGIEIP